MKRTTITVNDDVTHDLKILKALLGEPNMNNLLRRLMNSRGYNADFFRRMKEIKEKIGGVAEE